ncbi:ParB/RepB/Spo0J family partition protein [Herbaspirillum sp. RTI4]|uniref:ParB/RepB/Spo0J family partition protein n=1 Tax=Herbaspirillum sp. RTI4 TaxID=3048640 RepID=UPI002AB5D663|nr:ParB/RepB/Spo0J family partition protein [Herbaspirillum sp. RTI4]MDY7576744.1 ParB/RepB/Spo0J family partition protein [Herbaspirillum sp. RTI4]MEA9983409.1 ParB/RepB/Spo0J family partition protein [Herbaspirillum sp. RTI4]
MASIKERQANKAASINLDDDDKSPAVAVRSEPRTAPGQLMNLQGKYAQAMDENKQLLSRLHEAAPSELMIADLREVAGRRRKLTDEQFNELTNNLKHNPLVTPITVRKVSAGGYEIVSGHNRVQAFRMLGRDRILAAVIEADDDQTELSAFYANLLQPDLPDFEKYLGFNEIQLRHPELTRADIATNAGVAASTITQLMSFGGLPDEVIAILRDKPEILGANAAQDFAKLVKQGRALRVIDGIKKLAAGELDQGQAVKFAGADTLSKPVSKASEPVRIKAGKSVYCDLIRADKVLRVVFKTAEEATAAQEAVLGVLRGLAEGKNRA